MDENVLKEIEYLTRLIKQHKQRVHQRINKNKHVFYNTNLNPKPVPAAKTVVKKEPEKMVDSKKDAVDLKLLKSPVKVHVNPNFTARNPVIHINPKMQAKPQIHFNPKVRAKPLIHLNPKVIRSMSCESQKLNEKTQELTLDIKRSVYVNPELMKTLSSSGNVKTVKEKSKLDANNSSGLKSKAAKAVENAKSPARKLSNSSIIILSKRKLVRIRKSSKNSVGVATPIKFKKIAQSPRASSVKKIRTVNKRNSNTTKACKFVTINGVVYNSTRNRLVRRSLSTKRKSTTNATSDKFLIAANGKRLQRLKIRRESASGSGAKITLNANPKLNPKTIVSNKVKQRSIQILRNKMRKNNQPCLLYQRFGFCAAHKKGTCPKLHDKRQVSLCKRFLQGKCLLDKCPLSHDVGPEKMPTCKYFLEGCCTRDACPYLHVKVSSNTPVCIEFLKGYCEKGNECKRRHENVCPEFDKSGECPKGKYCPYPHKTQNPAQPKADKFFERKRKPSKRSIKEPEQKPEQENRPRYYEKTENLEQDLARKKESIMKKMKIVKNVHTSQENKETQMDESSQSESENEGTTSTRPPIGILPAYIPID